MSPSCRRGTTATSLTRLVPANPHVRRRLRSGAWLLPGQPGVLVLHQLEQGGLHLLDLRDLVQDELPVLPGRLDHELAAAEQPVDQPVRERDVADPDQREVTAGPGQDALAQPEAA